MDMNIFIKNVHHRATVQCSSYFTEINEKNFSLKKSHTVKLMTLKSTQISINIKKKFLPPHFLCLPVHRSIYEIMNRYVSIEYMNINGRTIQE